MSNLDEFKGLVLEYGDIEVTSQLNAKNVFVEVYYPITVIQGNRKIKVSDFNNIQQIRFDHILNVVEETKKLAMEDFLDLEALAELDITVNILPYDKNTIIYSLTDPLSTIDDVPIVFNLATIVSGNNAPVLDFIPDFSMELGNTLRYDINATDQDGDSLKFNGNIDINSVTGVITFTPSSIGDFDFNVCVSDTSSAEDCEEVSISVS